MNNTSFGRSESIIIDHVAYFDQYGFAIFKDSTSRHVDDRVHQYDRDDRSTPIIIDCWDKLLSNWEQHRNNYEFKLKKLLKQGIPNILRGRIWKKFLNSNEIAQNAKFDYQKHVMILRHDLLQLNISEFNISKAIHILGLQCSSQVPLSLLSVDILMQIMLDIDRTFPMHIMYMRETPAGIEGRASLFRVLSVYAVYNDDVAYCQGMSYIAAILLLYVSEEEAFWCLVALIERPKYLQGFYVKKLEKIQIHAQVFEKLLHRRMPQLCDHLVAAGIDPILFLAPWFLTLFSFLPCWDSVLFIWDLLLFEGVTAIFRVALAIMEILKPTLMNLNDVALLIPHVQHLSPETTRIDILSPMIWSIKVEKWEISCLYAMIVEDFQKKEREEKQKKLQTPQKPLIRKIIRESFLSKTKAVKALKAVENIPPSPEIKTNPPISLAQDNLVFAEFNSSGPFRLEIAMSPLNRTPEVEMRQLSHKTTALKCRRNLRC